ncbi:hypothetical protein B0H19DRAFT_1382511 [Mycena capillaripes]|nr:hypothetical protein B0H19DRAFT_1382511 [Mycena capillaripes]
MSHLVALGGSTAFSLLYITQKLAMQKCIGSHQTLTATHDQILSWTGLGSSLSSLFGQLGIPANITGTLAVAGYLAIIALLHLTTAALVAVETFDHTFVDVVSVQGIMWNASDSNATSIFPPYLGDFLQWMPLTEQSKTGQVGLFNGTLYDVLKNPVLATGPANVSAKGVNVTCGYLPNLKVTPSNLVNSSLAWNITLPSGFLFQPHSSGPNIITTQAQNFESVSTPPPQNSSWPSMILYTTNKVMDSDGNVGFPVELNPPMGPNRTVSELQFLQCSRSLVTQQAEVDPHSTLVIPSSLQPILHKNTSKWTAYVDPPQNTNSNLSPLESSEWPIPMEFSSVPMSIENDDDGKFASMDLYLMENLGLDPVWIGSGEVSSPPAVLYLHDIENALSSLLASYFWMGAHIRPRPLMVKYGIDENGPERSEPMALSVCSITVNRIQPATRLNLNIVAVSVGLGASVFALLLSLRFMPGNDVPRTPLTRMGILEVIWLFRNHPWLAEELEQVDEPTNEALRTAGMIKVQLGANEAGGMEMQVR